MKRLIVGNWKMNPLRLEEAEKMIKDIEELLNDSSEVVVCPPFLFISELKKITRRIKIGAQDCSFKNELSLTGEISPVMLKNLGVDYVIIGHSERRNYIKETSFIINQKINAAQEAGLSVILCVGEKDQEDAKRAVEKQLLIELNGIEREVVVAYEPVWAIGSGRSLDPDTAEDIKEFIHKRFNIDRILYGGSVKIENAERYLEKASFSGLLIGGASLNPDEFAKIASI